MKIICNKKEFAKLVRDCKRPSNCCGCALFSVCSMMSDSIDDLNVDIVDLCEVRDDG